MSSKFFDFWCDKMYTNYCFLLFITYVFATNLIKNYSFEDGTKGWVINGNAVVTSAQRFQGYYSLELDYTGGANVTVSTNFTIPVGKSATFYPRYRCTTAPATIRFYVDRLDNQYEK